MRVLILDDAEFLLVVNSLTLTAKLVNRAIAAGLVSEEEAEAFVHLIETIGDTMEASSRRPEPSA